MVQFLGFAGQIMLKCAECSKNTVASVLGVRSRDTCRVAATPSLPYSLHSEWRFSPGDRHNPTRMTSAADRPKDRPSHQGGLKICRTWRSSTSTRSEKYLFSFPTGKDWPGPPYLVSWPFGPDSYTTQVERVYHPRSVESHPLLLSQNIHTSNTSTPQ